MFSYLTYQAEAYVNIVVPPDSFNEVSGYSTELKTNVVLWTVFFIVIQFVIKYGVQVMWPTWFNALPVAKQEEFHGYVGSLIHHYAVSPFCVYTIVGDFVQFSLTHQPFPSNHFDSYFSSAGLVPFVLGYFFADTVVNILPDALKGNFIYVLHHFVAIYVIIMILTKAKGQLTQMLPVMMACEVSSIFFNTAWVLRALGFRDSSFVKALELLFAVTFFLFRNVNLVLLFYVLRNDIYVYGIGQLGIYVSIGLQYFWLYKIIQSLSKKSKKAHAKKN